MKILIVFGLACITFGDAGLLGPKECTTGPGYWCQSISNAKECKAVKHCIQTVWEKTKLPEDNDDVCTICMDMVKEARDQLLSNETQDEIRQVFEGSCKLIPIELVRAECIKMSDDFIPELVDMLASRMNPQMVCATAGLCNSKEVDRILLQNNHENAIAQTMDPSPGDCKDCKSFLKDVKSIVIRHSRTELLDHLLSICGRLSSLSDGCMALVQANFQNIYHFLTTINGGDVCMLFGMCDGLFGEQTVSFRRSEDEPCDFCVAIVTSWRNSLVSNTTKDEFKMILQGICHQTGSFEKECMALVDAYYDQLYDLLTHEIQPKQICQSVGLCGANSIFKKKVPLWPVRHIAFPTFDQAPLTGEDEANSYYHNTPLIGLDEANSYKQKHLIGEEAYKHKNMLGQDEANSYKHKNILGQDEANSYKHKNILGQDEANSYKHKNMLGQDEANSYKHKNILGQDEANSYKHKNMLGQDEANSYKNKVLPRVALSKSSVLVSVHGEEGTRHPVSTQKSDKCVMCEFTLHFIQNVLQDKKERAEIEAAVESVCKYLPHTVAEECQDYIEAYADQVIQMIILEIDPATICPMLKLCPGKQLAANPKVSTDSTCVLCEYAMTELDEILEDKTNEEKIKHSVEHVCLLLPKTIRDDCKRFIDTYLDQIVDLIVNGYTPREICVQIGICKQRTPHNALLFGKPENAQLPITRYFLPDIVQKAPASPPKFEERQTMSCVLCEFVVAKLDRFLISNATETEIKAAVNQVCLRLPSSLMNDCLGFMEEYGDSLIELLVNQMQPSLLCRKLSLCKDNFQQGMPKATVTLPSSDCIVCQDMVTWTSRHAFALSSDDALVGNTIVKRVCRSLPRKLKESCTELGLTYGPYMNKLKDELKSTEKVCQALKKCPRPLLVRSECTFGPPYWCKSKEHAEACQATKHCIEHVWKFEAPVA